MTISSINNGVIQVGIDLGVGGVLAELKFVGGSNYVNTDDTGRYIQCSLYDGNGLYTDQSLPSGTWGWNPVQAGDIYGHVSTVIDSTVTSDLLYSKTHSIEWFPINKGGGSGTPIDADIYIEQTITLVPNQTKAVKVVIHVTYFGTTARRLIGQELPVMFLNSTYTKLVRYAGVKPWSGDTVTNETAGTTTNAYGSEHWFALVDGGDDGVTLFVPGHAQWAVSSDRSIADNTVTVRPQAFLSFVQDQVRELTYFLIPGDVTQARVICRQLMQPPIGHLAGYHR